MLAAASSEFDAVQRERSDRRALGTTDSTGQRHEVAELADQIAQHQSAECRAAPTAAKPNPSAAMSNRHIGERSDDHAEAVRAQQGDRLVYAVSAALSQLRSREWRPASGRVHGLRFAAPSARNSRGSRNHEHYEGQ